MALTEVFTGAHGSLVLAPDATKPEGADAKAVKDAYSLETIGRVTDVEVRVTTTLKAFYEVGRRHPVSLSPGHIAISGTIGRAYVNGALLFLLLGRGARKTEEPEPYVQPAFNLTLTLADPARPGESVGLELTGVKFETWAYSVPEDVFVLENVRFMALRISVLDRPGGGGGGGGGATAGIDPGFPSNATA